MEFDNKDYEEMNEQVVEEEAVSEEVDKPEVEEKNEAAEWKDRFLRVTAEFENFKRRTATEQVQWIHRSQKALIVDILGTVDNFERALEQKNEENAELFVGIEMIYKSFLAFLKKYKVEEIATECSFDPEKHEAIMQTESPDHASDEIIQAVQKGFMMNGQVIRHAKVIVAK